ncbi:MAG TPA: hypothetical protein VKU86_04520 [Acidimicrobiales bacterium]|nr:hypothetical protein [Acidimicrobiales bacterium]
MRLFSLDPAEHAETYRSCGWVHVRDGVTPEFLDHLREYVDVHRRRSEEVLHGTGIRGAKDQYLYDPPPEVELSAELCDVVSTMCGVEAASFTLAERHIKSYSPDADPAPVAHKDRLASQVSIGVSIEVPEGSHLVLWPEVHREVNHFLTAELRESLAPEDRPDVILDGVPGVEIYDRPGDVVLFPGSAVWHLRRKSASTVNLYLKCNDFDCDPLGEDPSTEQRRLATAERLSQGIEALTDAVAVLSRRLEWVGTLTGRDGVTRPFAKMWDRPPMLVSDSEFELLEQLGARGAPNGKHTARAGGVPIDDDVLRLAGREVLDLLGPEERSRRAASGARATTGVGAPV